MVLRNFLFLSFLIISQVFFAQQKNGLIFTAQTWEEAKAQAEKENKLIFLDAYTSWCAPCQLMEEHIFTHLLVGQQYNDNFINLHMNMEKGEGRLFVSRYNISIYPTLIYLTSDGTVVHKVSGFKGVEELNNEARIALIPGKTERAMVARYEEGDRMPDFLYNYTYLKAKDNNGSHKKVFSEYLDSQRDWSDSRSAHIITDFTDDFYSPSFSYMVENQDLYKRFVGDEKFITKFDQLLSDATIALGENPTPKEKSKVINIAYPLEADSLNLAYRLNYYRNSPDSAAYALALYDYYTRSNHKSTDDIQSNISFLKTHLGDQHQGQISTWYKSFMDDNPCFQTIAAYSEILVKNNAYEDAKNLMKTSLKDAKKRGEDVKPYKKYLKRLKKLKQS